ncbi:MAG: hypothetical protein WAT74_09035, partial [Flavobacteriales bacterium]
MKLLTLRSITKRVAAALFASAALTAGAHAQADIATWTYEPLLGTAANPTPNSGANAGSGTSAVVGSMTGPTTATGSAAGCSQTSGTTAWAIGTANPGATNESSGVEFRVSTVGYTNIAFAYDHHLSNTGTRTARIQYTLNGTTWTNLDVDNTNFDNSACTNRGGIDLGRIDASNPAGSNVSDSWGRRVIDFSAITGANNNADFGVRILAAHYSTTGQFRQANVVGTAATGGTWRFDNVSFTGAGAPTVQDSEVSFAAITTSSFDVSWTNGNGARRVAIINTSNSFTAPADGTDPAANNVYGGSGEQVIFNGTGSSVSVSGLSPNTNYWVRVYGYNGTGSETLYLTTTASNNPNSESTLSPVAPTQLVITSINGGGNVIENAPFSITVQAQDGSNVPQNVLANTNVSIQLVSGFGSLGGTLTGTILAGTNSITISGITYDIADTDVEVEAVRTSGDVLTSGLSGLFDVLGAAQDLSFSNVPLSGIVSTAVPAFQVDALRADANIATEFTGAVTISVLSGPGAISGTLTQNAVLGSATFSGISFDTPGTYILTATASGLNDGNSPSILITLLPTLTELVMPQYIGSKTTASGNTNRSPLSACLQFDNLEPNEVYKLDLGMGLTSDVATVLGAGNAWNGTAFSGSTVNNAFTTDANGSSGPVWVFMEATGNGTRFGGGQVHNLRIKYAKQAFSFSSSPNFITAATFTSLDIAPTALTGGTTDDGAYLTGSGPSCIGGRYVLAFDNVAGTGAPLSVNMTRQAIATHSTSPTDNLVNHPASVRAILGQIAPSTTGDYALVIPIGANNPNGVRRIELRDAQNNFVSAITDADGIWPAGANTTTNTRRSVVSLSPADGALSPDADGDGICDNDDNCVDDANPGQEDGDSDGVGDACDVCPSVANGNPGDACDDGNPNTVLDVLGVGPTCGCAGVPCTTDLDFVYQADGNDDLTWQLFEQGTNTLVQTGGGSLIGNGSEATCLPDGCFYLVVTDGGGDGIVGGGYLLKINSSVRLIDNLYGTFGEGGFTSGGTSTIDNNEGFCLPVGTDRLIVTSCDRRDWKITPCGGEFVVANTNAAVSAQYNVNNANSGYQMWWYAPNGGYSFKRFQSHSTSNGLPASATRACHFMLNGWSGNQLVEGGFYNAKVRGRVNGVYNPWGPACRLTVNSAEAQCPRTKLMDLPGNQYLSCGQSRTIAANQYVHAKPVSRLTNSC